MKTEEIKETKEEKQKMRKINMKIIILIMKKINNMEQYNTMKKKMMIFTFHYTILN